MGCLALTWFYVTAATEHGRLVNTSKARGDQSGYLWDAQNVYANWHGRQPPMLIGERNRMPLYAGYLALFYHRGLTDPEYFEVAKRANIYLSVVLLVLLAGLFARELPPRVAINLTGVLAFGLFIYKAGYSQSELLFCFLMFVTFLGCWYLLTSRSGWHSTRLAALTGVAAGLAHLTKAAMLPFVAIVLAVAIARLGWTLSRGGSRSAGNARSAVHQAVSIAAFAIAFAVVIWPYVANSKRVFGHYLYNVNSTFYVWYDDWAHASVGTYSHGDGVGWPTMPEAELPSPTRYWREHSLPQIGARVASGFADMARTSYRTFGYLPYALAFGGALVCVVCTRWSSIAGLAHQRPWLVAFLAAYGVVYLLAIAFYYPTSGTGTGRFMVAHLGPLFFTLSRCLTSAPIRQLRWRIARTTFGLDAFHSVVTAMLALDIVFRVWPRLMTTYGGF